MKRFSMAVILTNAQETEHLWQATQQLSLGKVGSSCRSVWPKFKVSSAGLWTWEFVFFIKKNKRNYYIFHIKIYIGSLCTLKNRHQGVFFLYSRNAVLVGLHLYIQPNKPCSGHTWLKYRLPQMIISATRIELADSWSQPHVSLISISTELYNIIE